MYAIKWTRKTGESGVFTTRFRTEQKANEAASRLRLLDDMKGRHGECDYNVVEMNK